MIRRFFSTAHVRASALSVRMVLPMAFALALILTFKSTAFANSPILLSDPNQVSCEVVATSVNFSCVLKYEGLPIGKLGRATPEEANGDCFICRNTKDIAIQKGMKIIVDRRFDWNRSGYLTLTSREAISPICETYRPYPAGVSRGSSAISR